jgi:hypothetical protein
MEFAVMFTATRLTRFGRLGRSKRPLAPKALHFDVLEDRTAPALLGQTLYPADNPWNQKVAAAPVAANSAAIINNIVTRYGNGRLHPDFGQDDRAVGADLYGIPVNIVHGNSAPKVTFVLDEYEDESDPIQVPMPDNPVIEGDYQDGPRVGVDERGDSHLLIYDVDNGIAYELYRASRPSENGDNRWHADQESVWDMKTNSFRTIGWTSADAAGRSVLAGLVRPDEGLPVSQGGQGVINHAIRFTLQNAVILDQFIYPASHTANPGNTNAAIQPAMGARFRLKAGVDISQLNPQSRIIAQAMKDYGMIVADNGSNFFFSGASYAVDANNQFTVTWNDDDIQDSTRGLKSLHFADFEVVDLTPIVTDLSVHNGPAGTSVTIIGQNFSGAAGRLKVLFGAAAATAVTVIDDGHVVAVAPAGAGTVDVRVQSGLSTAANSDNIKNNIFGYGLSAVSVGGRFTFGAAAQATTTTLTSTPNASTGGSLVTFTATVSPSPGNLGAVTFLDGGAALPGGSNVALAGGVASFQISTLTAGTHAITANYSGAAGYAASTSNTVSQVVAAAPRVVGVTVNGNIPSLAGVQRSRVASVVVVFDQAVELDPSAFTIALHTNSVFYDAVEMPSGYGALPTSLVLTPSADRKTWVVTFAGNTDNGTDGLNSLKDGVYDFTVSAAKVHPLGAPGVNMAANSTTTFHRLFGDTDAPAATDLGPIGTDYQAMLVTGDNLVFRNAFNRPASYNAAFDLNGDGLINSGENLQFRMRFNKSLIWRA